MRIIISILIVFIISSFSCVIPIDPDLIEQTILKTNQDIVYKKDIIDNWQTAAVTRSRKTGDCEDFVILCIDEVYRKYGIKCDMRFIRYSLSCEGHAVLEYDGIRYECTDHDSVKVEKGYVNQELWGFWFLKGLFF
ncbi:MAG: hypothetical protein JXB50_12115 [Spirochaetes bacterium]|nr:hypothetical protein [Spirochaetota bacterium]